MHWRRVIRHTIIAWNVVAPLICVALLVQGRGWLALGVIMSAHALWLVPTLIPACQWCGEVVTTLAQARNLRGEEGVHPDGANEVWLTIDDGPDPADTPKLLDLLEAHEAKATFFFIGAKAAQHPKLVRAVVERGHQVANHTMNHVQYWFWAFGPGGVRREIAQCQETLAKITGSVPVWFRAPAGLKNLLVQQYLEKKSIRLAGWSARGLDGVVNDKARVMQRLLGEVKPGGIILMHEGRLDDKGARLAPEVLSELLEWMKSSGYLCVLPGERGSTGEVVI